MSTYGERLRQALIFTGTSQSDLARAIGVRPQSIQYLCRPTAQRSRYTYEIAEALGISAAWLAEGTGSMVPSGGEAAREEAASYETFHSRQIPVIDYVQAGSPRPVIDAYMAGNGFETITLEGTSAIQVGPYTFALEVRGDSMVDNSPYSIRDGDKVVVDPDEPVRPGDIVVAKLDREDTATLKKYRDRGIDGNGVQIVELKPLNEDYASIIMDANNPGHIIGPVVEIRKRLRR